MARGREGLPRPLLSETCEISFEARTAGIDKLELLVDTMKSIPDPFFFSIVDKSTRDIRGMPDTPVVTVNNNRIAIQDIQLVTAAFADDAGDESLMDTMTLRAEPTLDSVIPRPFAKTTTTESTFIIEVKTDRVNKSDIDTLRRRYKEFDDVRVNNSLDTILVDVGDSEIAVSKLTDFREDLRTLNVQVDSAVLACGVEEF